MEVSCIAYLIPLPAQAIIDTHAGTGDSSKATVKAGGANGLSSKRSISITVLGKEIGSDTKRLASYPELTYVLLQVRPLLTLERWISYTATSRYIIP
jgi:hypothetical protein